MKLTNPAQQLALLPARPGVYRFYDKGEQLLYIGKAKDLSVRVRAYFEGREHGPHIKKMTPLIASLDVITTGSEIDALLLEQRLIHEHKPKYNIIFRDDKTYSYLSLSKHEFPQLKHFRGKRTTSQELFGPYVDSKVSRAKLSVAQKTFKIRTCDDSTFSNRTRPCVLHQIGRCTAPCVEGYIDKADYIDDVDKARRFLKGSDQTLISDLAREMTEASQSMAFERAGALRDQIRLISDAASHHDQEGSQNVNCDAVALAFGLKNTAAHIFEVRDGLIKNVYSYDIKKPSSADEAFSALMAQHYVEHEIPPKIVTHHTGFNEGDAELLATLWCKKTAVSKPSTAAETHWLSQAQQNAQQSIDNIDTLEDRHAMQQEKLRALFPLYPGKEIKRIECFDVSHFQSEAAVSSCVVYEDFSMRPQKYRLFNISQDNAGDDFGSMKETLIRRYQTQDPEELPQLIIIDGGLGQMNKAQEALRLIGLDIPMIGIAKGVTRKLGNEELLCTWGEAPKRVDKSDPALLLLSHIRDESHRFAITRNRKIIQNKRIQSRILEIPGVGPAKKKSLILALGSLQNIAAASKEQLSKVPGISPTLAEKIKRHLDMALGNA